MGRTLAALLVIAFACGSYWRLANGAFGQHIDPLRLFPFEQRVGECEKVIAQRLLSPSSYHRVDVEEVKAGDVTADVLSGLGLHAGADADLVRTQLDDNPAEPPELHEFLLSYDASNAFGTPLRGHAVCDYIWPWGHGGSGLQPTVFVDGASAFDWTLDQLKVARQ